MSRSRSYYAEPFSDKVISIAAEIVQKLVENKVTFQEADNCLTSAQEQLYDTTRPVSITVPSQEIQTENP